MEGQIHFEGLRWKYCLINRGDDTNREHDYLQVNRSGTFFSFKQERKLFIFSVDCTHSACHLLQNLAYKCVCTHTVEAIRGTSTLLI